jgi:hypothetical protein
MAKRFAGSLGNRFPFPLSDGQQDIQDHASAGRAGVDAVRHAEKLLTGALAEITVDQGLPVTHTAGESVQLYDDQPARLATPENRKGTL